jgi:hypothetical protein
MKVWVVMAKVSEIQARSVEKALVEHCALNKDVFLQKPISTDDLIMEIINRINSTL